MPLLDLCSAAESGLIDAGAALGPFGVQLVERAEEIRFRVELLKRFAEGQPVRQPGIGVVEGKVQRHARHLGRKYPDDHVRADQTTHVIRLYLRR